MINKETLPNLLLSNEAISLALVTAFSLLITFAWEGGKLLFYGAPYRFMELNTLTILVASVIFILIYSPFALQILTYYKQKESNKLFIRSCVTALAYSTPTYLATYAFFSPSETLTFILLFILLCFLLPAIPVAFSCNDTFTKYWRRLHRFERFLSFRGKTTTNKFALNLGIAVYLLLAVFFMSYSMAYKEKSYWMIKGETDAFIITNYGDRVIVGRFLDNKKIISECIEIRSIGDRPLKVFNQTLLEPPIKAPKLTKNQCN